MKKLLLALVVVGALALTIPARADAHVSVGIALPGFGLFVNAPPPPPVVYAPPAVTYYGPAYYYPPYYRPAPVVYPYWRGRWGGYHHRGWHRGW
jgi:hypothetical protein